MKHFDYKLIERVFRKCPFCNRVHIVERRWRFAEKVINEQKVRFKESFYRCLVHAGHQNNEFIPEELQKENDNAAQLAYQQFLHGIEDGEITYKSLSEVPLTKCCRQCGKIVGYNSWFHGYYCPHCYDLERIYVED